MPNTTNSSETHLSPAALAERNASIRERRALPKPDRPTLRELSLEHNVSAERIRQIAGGRRFDGRNGRLTLRRDDESAVILVYEGDGRYEARFRAAGDRHEERVGFVLGGRRKWCFEGQRGAFTLQDKTLRTIAERIGAWATTRPRASEQRQH